MNICVGDYYLRKPEPKDVEWLYSYKNDAEIGNLLGGFSMGYSMADLHDWLEFHRKCREELLLSIARINDDVCIGHVGLYKIDFRIRQAEFAILIGDRSSWGKGVGRNSTKAMLDYGFNELNLNRLYLSVLTTNERAINLYQSLGFNLEGRLRQAQFKGGNYIDMYIMGLLRNEYGTVSNAEEANHK